jgi:hypothetical protein
MGDQRLLSFLPFPFLSFSLSFPSFLSGCSLAVRLCCAWPHVAVSVPLSHRSFPASNAVHVRTRSFTGGRATLLSAAGAEPGLPPLAAAAVAAAQHR